MYSRQKALWLASLLIPLIFCVNAFGQDIVVPDETADDTPEVTARVARITFVSGEVQIRRAGSTDWEKAAVDLPVVEGDEIATGGNTRVEIQLDSNGHIRLDQNSALVFTTLQDDGTALSLSQGTLGIRLLAFDKEKSFLEIDAPKTTVAIQTAGTYRIDAGAADSKEVRVTALDSGEARVYSDNSGFTLRSGRSSKLFIDGSLAGEWETADAANFVDDFDKWALERDAAIAKNLSNSYYDQYYDREIYGAEDLNGYGEWIHTNDYGYVWRPYQNAISGYDDWSPYRYGEWRWVPPFGWTWVNDEPWGWATYHHGRWFFDNGFWYWSPYGYYRGGRSWWSPAFVVLTSFNDDFCWYPLPYRSHYYDCNWYFHRDRRDGRDRHWRNDRDWDARRRVPPNGVITTPGRVFGTGRERPRRADQTIAKTVIDKDPRDERMVPRLPSGGEVAKRESGRIRPGTPIFVPRQNPATIGVIERKDKPVDDYLRNNRVMDRRPPRQPQPQGETPNGGAPVTTPAGRGTGAVGRQPREERRDTGAAKGKQQPGETPPIIAPRRESDSGQIKPTETPKPPKERQRDPGSTPPIIAPRPDRDTVVTTQPVEKPMPPRPQDTPRRPDRQSDEPKPAPPQRTEQPRQSPPPQRTEQPRSSPPPQRTEQPRPSPPPQRTEQPKASPPPQKTESPKSQPAPSRDTGGRKKDG